MYVSKPSNGWRKSKTSNRRYIFFNFNKKANVTLLNFRAVNFPLFNLFYFKSPHVIWCQHQPVAWPYSILPSTCISFLFNAPAYQRCPPICPTTLKRLSQSVASHVAISPLVDILNCFYQPISAQQTLSTILNIVRMYVCMYIYLAMHIFPHFICCWQEIIFWFHSSTAATKVNVTTTMLTTT